MRHKSEQNESGRSRILAKVSEKRGADPDLSIQDNRAESQIQRALAQAVQAKGAPVQRGNAPSSPAKSSSSGTGGGMLPPGLEALPDEVLYQIFEGLTNQQLQQVRQVNHRFNALVEQIAQDRGTHVRAIPIKGKKKSSKETDFHVGNPEDRFRGPWDHDRDGFGGGFGGFGGGMGGAGILA